MRSDMAKVIVERPRMGHRHGHIPEGRPRPLVDDDGAPLGFAVRTHTRTKKTKWLNENLAPLRRYLDAQVGRRWDDVYAEICAHLRPDSTVQQHVRDHIGDFVAVSTRMENGKVVAADRWGGVKSVHSGHWRLYVDPRDGRIKKGPGAEGWRRRRREAEAAQQRAIDARMRPVSSFVQLHKLSDGCWWEVRLARAPGEASEPMSLRYRYYGPQPDPRNDSLDVVLSAGLTGLSRPDLYRRFGVYAVAKRQLSKVEKRHHGLA